VKAINSDVCKKNKFNWLPQQCPLGYSKSYVSFITHICISTNAENMVDISLVAEERFGGICPFLPSYPVVVDTLVISGAGYWTNLNKVYTGCSYNIAIKLFDQSCHTHIHFGMPACQIKVSL